MRTGLLFYVIFAVSCVKAQVLPHVDFSGDFIGGANQQVTEISGRLEDMVAIGTTQPINYINQAGELTCPILYRIKDNQWQPTGDIGAINGGTACPLVTGGAVPFRTVVSYGADICIGGDFLNLGGNPLLDYFACYSEGMGWYQPGGDGTGPNGPVHALAYDGGSLYLGGSFSQIDNGISAKNIVRTDGFFWTPLYSDAQQSDNGVVSSVQSILLTASFVVVQSGSSTLTWNPTVPEWKTRGTHNGSITTQADVVSFGNALTVATKNASAVSGDPAGSVSVFDLGTESWSPLGSSLNIDTHFAQLAYGLGPLYASGDFTAVHPDAKGLAWFNGIDWQPAPNAQQLGNLNNSQPLDMQQAQAEFCLLMQGIPLDSEIYWQTQVCYDGSQWNGDNRAPLSNVVHTLAEHNGRVFHGGDFTVAGDQFSPYVAKLKNNHRWKAISDLTWAGSGNGSVSNLHSYQGALYATGNFDQAGGQAVTGLARWDGSLWQPVANNVSATLMTLWDNKLILAGFQNSLGPVISWDGSTIQQVGNIVISGQITAMGTYQGDLVIASLVSGTAQLHRYDGVQWQSFGGSLSGYISSLQSAGSDLFVAGDFSAACNGVSFVAANNIYRWDGSACHDLAGGVVNSGFSESVNAMAYGHGLLFVTGRFNQAGAATANSLAVWNGQQWNPLDLGLTDGLDEGHGNALLLLNDTLYVAGYFEQAGDQLSHNFAALMMDFDAIFSSGFE
ncbi:MAG: hypothetical protein OQK49_08655 [Proteobacteria bacterium]|nr:hypothetical protein [Pseudomonadota bacterium]